MNLFSLEGKTALVTGVSKGLGQAIAQGLALAGAEIVGMGVSEMTHTRDLIETVGRKFHGLTIDLSHPREVKNAAKLAINLAGKIDILVNNAGLTLLSPAESYSETDFDKVMDLNVKSLFLLSQEIGMHMMQHDGGTIINVASIQSIIGGAGVSAYVASKHAVAGLTKTLATEWGPKGIRVNAIAPGFCVTDNTQRLRQDTDKTQSITKRIPLGRWGNPTDMQGPVVFLASDASSYVNGHILVVDGGYLSN